MIVAAAIKQDGIVYKGKPFVERHHHLIHRIAVETGKIPVTGEQGFITDKLEFLNRKEASLHALECKQIKCLKYSDSELFSEDLW